MVLTMSTYRQLSSAKTVHCFRLAKSLQWVLYCSIFFLFTSFLIYNHIAKFEASKPNASGPHHRVIYDQKAPHLPNVQFSRSAKKPPAKDLHLACPVPKLDPWDKSIEKYIVHPKNLSCEIRQRYMSFIDNDGYLKLNQTELDDLEATGETFDCFYSTFDRSNESWDDGIEFDEPVTLTRMPVQLLKDMVKVTCYCDEINEIPSYVNVHSHPSESKRSEFLNVNEKQLSVLFFMLDSVSYSAMQRNLPRTFSYTSDVMGMKFMKAFNKVGDNTFPNVMAMLMGKRVTDEQDDMPREMDGDYSLIKFDNWPIIWKEFAKKGYATIFNEDHPSLGMFHMSARGFSEKPVDFYYHAFWLAVDRENDADGPCFFNQPKSEMVLDITRRHLMSMSNKRQFIVTSTMELSHGKENEVELLDDGLLRFWKDVYEGGYLNHTAVIFVSDHGLRTGPIRTTPIGRIEERLPFLGIYFPKWFYQKHPHIAKHLDYNSEIMSSSYDVHETLLNIYHANYEGVQSPCGQRGQSHLYPLPTNRTCHEAGIPLHYCTCLHEGHLETNKTLVIAAAKVLVKHLNFLLRNVTKICDEIELNRILFARDVEIDAKRQGSKKVYHRGEASSERPKQIKEIRIGIETYPHNALFEAFLRRNGNIHRRKAIWRVIGTVSRYSRYAGLSDCVEDKFLKKYCSCSNLNQYNYIWSRGMFNHWLVDWADFLD